MRLPAKKEKEKGKGKKDKGGTSLRAAAFHHLFACALTPACSLSLCSLLITELYKNKNNKKREKPRHSTVNINLNNDTAEPTCASSGGLSGAV